MAIRLADLYAKQLERDLARATGPGFSPSPVLPARQVPATAPTVIPTPPAVGAARQDVAPMGVGIGAPRPIPTPFVAPQPAAPPPTAATPISEAAARLPPEISNIPLVGGLSAVGLAFAQNIGDALAQFGAPTTGEEITAAPVRQLLQGVPGLGLASTAAQAASKEFAQAAETPTRDVPVLGGVVRGVETLTNALQAGYRTIAEPAVGATALGASVLERLPYGDVALKAFGGTTGLQQLRATQPNLPTEIGSSPEEIAQLTAGFLGQWNAPEQSARLEDLFHRAGQREAEKNPVAATVLAAAFDPLTYVDAAGVFGQVSRFKNLVRSWETGADVARFSEFAAKQTPLDRVLLSVFRPATAKPGELLAAVSPAETSVLRRVLRPFELTPASKVYRVVERFQDSLIPFMTEGRIPFSQKLQLVDGMAQAAQEGALIPRLQEFMGESGVLNTVDFNRGIRGALGFKPGQVLSDYKRAREIFESISQTQRTPLPRVLPETEETFLRASAQELGEGYRGLFDTQIEAWRAGKLDLKQLDDGIERVAGYQLATELIEHTAGVMAKEAGLRTPGPVTRLVDWMKAYQGLIYVGGSPATIATNILNNFARLVTKGVDPTMAESELTKFYGRIGYSPTADIAAMVSKAVGEQLPGAAGPFGARVPAWVKQVPGLKQLSGLWQKSENLARQQAWAAGFERYMAGNFKYSKRLPQMPFDLETHIRTTDGEQGFRRAVAGLESARTASEAEDILLRNMPTMASYRDDLAASLSEQLGVLSGREITITPEMIDTAWDPATRNMFDGIFREAWERSQKTGQDFLSAWRQARARATAGLEPLFPVAPPAKAVSQRPITLPEQAPRPIVPPVSDDIARFWDTLPAKQSNLVAQQKETFVQQMGRQPNLQELQRMARGEAVTPPTPPRVRPQEPVTPAPVLPKVQPEFRKPPAPAPELPPAPPIETPATYEDIAKRIRDIGIEEWVPAISESDTLPNILSGRFSQEDWLDMTEAQRKFAVGDAMARLEDINARQLYAPGADVYQAGPKAGLEEIPAPSVIPPAKAVIPPSEMPPVLGTPEELRQLGREVIQREAAPAPRANDMSTVFALASSKGISTTTPTGKPFNQHLFNVLNKHKAPDAAPFGKLPDIQTRINEVVNILENYTPAPTRPPRAVPAELATEPERMLRENMPTQLSENVATTAQQMKDELLGGQPGGRVFGTREGEPGFGVVAAYGTSNPPWYGELVEKYGVKREVAVNALEKIIADKGKDKGITVERLKEQILNQLADGLDTPVGRLPPDWEAAQLLGRPQAEVDRAFKVWQESMVPPTAPTQAESAVEQAVRGERPGQVLGVDAMHQVFNAAKEQGAQSVLDANLNARWQRALVDDVLDLIETNLSKQSLAGARVLPPEIENAIREYITREYTPALNQAKTAANAVGRSFVTSTVLNYNERLNIDDGLSLVAPFSYWWLHALGGYTRDFVDHPALLAFYVRLRQNLDKQAEGMPERYRHRIAIDMPLASQLGLGDSLWIDPLKAIMPVGELYQMNSLERGGYQSVKEDGTVDYNSVFQDLFGVHTPYKLAWAALNGQADEIPNTLASIPAVRLLRGVTAPFTPGGFGFGLEGKFDRFYYERALGELVAEGKITEDQLKAAMLTRSGPVWDMARQRAGLENYTARELTAAVGARGYVFTPGEQKYYEARKAKDALITDSIRRMGGNPDMSAEQKQEFLKERGFYDSPEWKDFKTAHPELDAFAFRNIGFGKTESQQQEARYRDYLVDGIWKSYNDAPRLRKKMISVSLGKEFSDLFLEKPAAGGRDYSQIPLSMLMGWGNAVSQMLLPVAGAIPPQPDPYRVVTTTKDQEQRYQQFYDEVQQSFGWTNVHKTEQEYFALADKAQRKSFLLQHPELRVVWDTEREFYADNPDILKLLESVGLKKPAAAASTQGGALNAAMQVTGLDWDTVNSLKEQYNRLPKGTGARTKFLQSNPALLRYFQLSGAIYKSEQELLESQRKAAPPRKPFTPQPYYKRFVERPARHAPHGPYPKHVVTFYDLMRGAPSTQGGTAYEETPYRMGGE